MGTKNDALFERSHTHGKAGRQIPRVNSASLRDEFDAYKADITSLRKKGKVTKEADVVISGLCRLSGILITILLEKTTKKTSKKFQHPTNADWQG